MHTLTAPIRTATAADSPAARWRTSLHEAGHAVVRRVLLGNSTHATVIEAGWGLAKIGDGGGVPKSDESAIAVAAGFVAEELAEKHPPPLVPVSPLPSAVRCPEETARLKAALTKIMSDDEALARWCIAGQENRPRRWARQYDWVCDKAGAVVAAHAEEIVRVATGLFADGVITLAADVDAGIAEQS